MKTYSVSFEGTMYFEADSPESAWDKMESLLSEVASEYRITDVE